VLDIFWLTFVHVTRKVRRVHMGGARIFGVWDSVGAKPRAWRAKENL